jgi:hypothetical protein
MWRGRTPRPALRAPRECRGFAAVTAAATPAEDAAATKAPAAPASPAVVAAAAPAAASQRPAAAAPRRPSRPLDAPAAGARRFMPSL